MFEFNPMNFITNLKWMGIGMLGVFMYIYFCKKQAHPIYIRDVL